MICRALSLAFLFSLAFGFANLARSADPPSLADRLGRLPGDLIKEKKTDPEAVEALFRSGLARAPEKAVQQRLTKNLKGAVNREEALSDILWALVNSSEFAQLHGINNLKAAQDFTDRVAKAMKKK